MAAEPPQIAKATLTAIQDGAPSGDPVTVHFNPASLVYSVENTVSQQAAKPTTTQYVAQFSGKLSMDLQFDTTDTGADVRTVTNQVAMFMQPAGSASTAGSSAAPPSANSNGSQSAPAAAPSIVSFQWGSYEFRGVMDSFKETIDFFSNDGVALRALVTIGISRQDQTLNDGSLSGPTQSGSLVPTSGLDSVLSLVTRGGNPLAARAIGQINGLASLRFTGGAPIQVSAGVQLNPPAAFVTAPSAGASAGLSLGISGGVSMGAAAGVSIGAGAGVSGMGPAFGGSASAGVPATAGAFAGLQTGRAAASTTGNLNPLQMMRSTTSAGITTTGSASFSLGGAANSSGSAGLATNVGGPSSLSDRLTFSSDN